MRKSFVSSLVDMSQFFIVVSVGKDWCRYFSLSEETVTIADLYLLCPNFFFWKKIIHKYNLETLYFTPNINFDIEAVFVCALVSRVCCGENPATPIARFFVHGSKAN